MSLYLPFLQVRAAGASATTGVLQAGDDSYPCTLGRGGLKPAALKREGDGATPMGSYACRYVFYRADRVAKPETGLAVEILTPETGWCEDVTHVDYNRRVRLPHPSAHDCMTRDDNLYDIIVVLGHNDAPVVQGFGSAVFIHLARPDFTPTAGCIGLREEALRAVLRRCSAETVVMMNVGD